MGTNGMLANLEALVYPSQTYGKAMQQYVGFFASLFGGELIAFAFAYERMSKNGLCEAISNQPRIAEIFIETKTYQEMQSLNQKSFFIKYGFIYPSESAEESVYNNFRIQLNKELDLYSTFYITETCLNYQSVFVWNFRPPLKSSSLTEWENQILHCFISNMKSIQYTFSIRWINLKFIIEALVKR